MQHHTLLYSQFHPGASSKHTRNIRFAERPAITDWSLGLGDWGTLFLKLYIQIALFRVLKSESEHFNN